MKTIDKGKIRIDDYLKKCRMKESRRKRLRKVWEANAKAAGKEKEKEKPEEEEGEEEEVLLRSRMAKKKATLKERQTGEKKGGDNRLFHEQRYLLY